MTDTQPDNSTDSELQEPRPVARRALLSVLAAFFGVQSSANRERDVEYGSLGYFILFGIVGTIMLVGLIIVFVKILMMQVA